MAVVYEGYSLTLRDYCKQALEVTKVTIWLYYKILTKWNVVYYRCPDCNLMVMPNCPKCPRCLITLGE